MTGGPAILPPRLHDSRFTAHYFPVRPEMLELVELTKMYRGVPAVRGLTPTAAPGQVIGLLGPNGSGKSTTVRMIVGLLRPSRGRLLWRGVDIDRQLIDYQA